MIARTTRLLAALALLTGGLSCAGETTRTTPCDNGWSYERQGDVEWCTITAPAQETGFNCPPEMAFPFTSGGAAICSSSADGMSGWTPADDPDGPDDPSPAWAGKLDILLVIDDSASMGEEQVSLGQYASDLVAALDGVDYQLAVTTTNVLSEGANGRFVTQPATHLPFSSAASETAVCYRPQQMPQATEAQLEQCTSPDCGCGHLGEAWTCSAPSQVKYVFNCNDTVNSKCRLTCTSHADCDAALVGEAEAAACAAKESACTYRCLNPSSGSDPTNSGCVRRLPQDCSSELPPVLTAVDGPAHLSCLMTVGANQHNDANLESGIGAAIAALDPKGPNPGQYASLVRSDAQLLIVFISDEEDCTVADPQSLKKEEYGLCGCLPTTDQGGPLLPVAQLAEQLKGLKVNPNDVHVAAIVGDSLASDPAQISADRAAYRDSRCNQCEELGGEPHSQLFNTYVCDSPLGKADLGSRYLELVDVMGGQAFNICAPDGRLSMLASIVSELRGSL